MAPRPANAPIAPSLRQSVTSARSVADLFTEVAVK
jgi:hypothetical protein